MDDNITTDLRFSMVPAWLLASSVSDKAVRLYGVLAGYADSETGQAYPGRTLLSKRLDCSTKTVDRAVAELTELGAIRKQQRVKDGFYQSSLYTVVRIDPASQVSQPRVTHDPTPRHTRPDPASPVSQRTITTEREPVKLEPENKNTEIVSRSVDAFDQFWEVYPGSSSKPDALKKFAKALKRVSFDVLLAGAIRYRDDPNRDPGYTKNPATWLHNDCWNDPLKVAPGRKLSNSEQNIANLKADMAKLEQPTREITDGQARNQSVIDLGINLRSADSV